VVEQALHECLVIYDSVMVRGVDKKRGSQICLIPELQGHTSLSQKRESNIYHVVVFVLSSSVLLVCVRARDKMGYPYASKE
jgi:hypothetical protein